MKRIITSIMIFLLILCSSCEIKPIEPLDENAVETSDVKTLSAQIGIEMSLPSQARNVKCFIINDLIGETEFSYEGVIYVHRSSKTYAEAALYGFSGKLAEVDSIELFEDVTVSINTVDGNGRLALWYENGNHHSLYTTKTVGADTLEKIIIDL